MSDEKKLSEMETIFSALADKTRLRLLNLLRDGEICVNFLVDVLKESQPKISRHLAYLRSAGIVEARRKGKWIYYKVVVPQDYFAGQILQNTLEWLDSQNEMQAEYKKLAEIYNSVDNTNKIILASKADIFVKPDIKAKQNQPLETFLL